MCIKMLHHVCIQTDKYKESLDFYTNVLGFKVIRESKDFHTRDYNTWIKFGEFMIELQTAKSNDTLHKWSSSNAGPVHLGFLVDDVQKEYDRIKNLGYTDFKLKNGQIVYEVEGEKTLPYKLSKILITTISFHDYKEDFYHAFLAGIFTGLSYKVKSNAESGEGRSDVVVKDRIRFRVSIFEVKHSAKRADMEKDCNRALTQIVDRKYAVEYEDEFDEIFCYGIAFYKKRCLVKYLNKK